MENINLQKFAYEFNLLFDFRGAFKRGIQLLTQLDK